KENILWQDKTPLTANDVIFTFQAIKNPEYKSPLRVSFTGVEINKADERTVKFILAEPYAAFLELLTFGILPANIWEQIAPAAANLAELNLKPVGSGPYGFKSLPKEKSGKIWSYELEANKNYIRENPYINTIIFKFSPLFGEGVSTLNEGKAEGIDYLPREYENKITNNNLSRYYLTQPQLTALFFNQNNLGALKDIRTRQALAFALDKISLATLFPHTQIIDSPILPMFTEFYNDAVAKYNFDLDRARALLKEAGWQVSEVPDSDLATTTGLLAGEQRQKKGEEWLTIAITTIDQPDTMQVAELIKQAWEAINIKVTINAVSAQLIQTEVIRPRNYQVLLYGVVLGGDPDQYPFWHSSQIGPSGLNLANYANKEIDILLEDGRITTNTGARQEKYKKFQEIIARDLPAIFLYSQSYPYLQNNKIKGFDTQAIIIPSDRFANITNWYINIRKKIVW
ncbi:MAG: peptide ABC transporter substrate-binding protein, partial [Patescibacteria group bacterium]